MGIFDWLFGKKDIENNKKEQQKTKERLKRKQKERKQSSNDETKIYQDYHDNGKLKTEGNKKNGKRHGLWKFYDENGQLKEERTFNNDGFLHGNWKLFHENGKLRSETEYKNGKFISEKSWDENGNEDEKEKNHKTLPEYWMDNPGSSLVKENYDTGELSFELIPTEFTNLGDPDSITEYYLRRYYKNGNLIEEGKIKKDLDTKEGLWKFYYENGQLQEEEVLKMVNIINYGNPIMKMVN